MSDIMFVKDAAKLWGLTERRVTELCKSGKIIGAKKEGRTWVIPSQTSKPADKRIKSGCYKNTPKTKLPLPIGIADYRSASTEYYYVDKTLMLKDLIDEKASISLFTRPRRFGKTLNMDMIKTFFEKSKEDTSVYFKNKKIWSYGKKYQNYQGKYPVIFLSFKDIKYATWLDTFLSIKELFSKEAYRHIELETSEKCNKYEKETFSKLLSKDLTEIELANILLDLTRMLYNHYSVKPIIIIDEYDIPIQQGYINNFYDKVISFMRNLFSAGFKDNSYLTFGIMTGILRVSKESIFSGLNNLTINSVLDNKYSSYFGFTHDEVKEMLNYYDASLKYDEICTWYDGYKFGNTEIFNPWSVVNYLNNQCEARMFWGFTSSNDIIGEILNEANKDIYNKLTSLINGTHLTTSIDTGVIYPQIKTNPSTIFSFLLVTGYLKPIRITPSFDGNFMCEVSLPNKEITYIYKKEILNKLEYIFKENLTTPIQEALFSKDNVKLKCELENLLLSSASYFDTLNENFYHGLMLGICALFNDTYVTSNKESGEGRYDIELKPFSKDLPAILIELKHEKTSTTEKLKRLAKDAYDQIIIKKYDTNLLNEGYKTIYKYGIAFSGKLVEAVVE